FESGAGSTQHDPRAGVYMAFDLDPTLSATDNNHNVFVFVVHAIDANSVVGATEQQLRAVNVGTSTNWYTPANASPEYFSLLKAPADVDPGRRERTFLEPRILFKFCTGSKRSVKHEIIGRA
ncbi:hypothetical protein FRC06_010409, partial [Ceratobasidium sp. 370]